MAQPQVCLNGTCVALWKMKCTLENMDSLYEVWMCKVFVNLYVVDVVKSPSYIYLGIAI